MGRRRGVAFAGQTVWTADPADGSTRETDGRTATRRGDRPGGRQHARTAGTGRGPASRPGRAAQTSRRAVAHRVSSWRLESCSFRSTAETWLSTVFTEMNSCLAISLYA
jgi:hypothetical protein